MDNQRKMVEGLTVFAIAFFVLLLSLSKGPQFLPDSGSYENNSILRIGMYPMTIALFKFLFSSHAFKWLATFQTLFALGAIYCLARFIRHLFNLPFYMYLLVFGIFLFPIVSHSPAWDILSESIAYPLFLLTALFFFKFAVSKQNKHNIIFATLLFLLCFSRQQFVFFYVVAFVYAFYLLIFEKNCSSARQILLATALSFGTFFIAERSYHLVCHGHFAGTPFVGTQFLMRPLFLISSESLNNITEPKQKLFMTEVVKELEQQKITSPDASARELYAYEYFYNTMYHQISSKIWGKVWSKVVLDEELNKNHTSFQVQQIIDHNALMMSLKLIQTNFLKTVTYYIKDILRGMGGYSCSFFIGLIFFACIAVGYITKKLQILHLLSISTILMHVGNSSLVCLFEPPLTRYVYATNALCSVMIVIVLSKLFPYLIKQNEELSLNH